MSSGKRKRTEPIKKYRMISSKANHPDRKIMFFRSPMDHGRQHFNVDTSGSPCYALTRWSWEVHLIDLPKKPGKYGTMLRRSELTMTQCLPFQSSHGLTNLSSLPFKCHLLRLNEVVSPDNAQYVPFHFQFEAVSLSLPSSITLINRVDSINVIMKSHRFEVIALFITILILCSDGFLSLFHFPVWQSGHCCYDRWEKLLIWLFDCDHGCILLFN